LNLVIACLVVSVIYAMTGSDEPDRWFKETLGGFSMMFGGIMVLGVVVYAVARWVS
jgi:hypothetical protein